PTWDHAIRSAFTQVERLTQPLWDLVGQRNAVLASVRGLAPVPSILSTRYLGPSSGQRHRAVG
ncbi:MAG: hypothetical protein RIF41_28675, partial [Polyangiaceae bacterium]